MNSNQYTFAGFAQQAPPSQPYATVKHPEYANPRSNSNEDKSLSQQVPYIQPQYGIAPSGPFLAELPAPLPQAPPTSTPAQQLNEDELLAHKLQNMEVEEAKRRSSSNVSLRHSQYSVRETSSLASHRSQSPLDARQPSLPPRPHSESFSSVPFYGPDSFGPPPTYFESNDGRMLMANSGMDDQPPPTPQVNLPEVVIGARPLSTFGYDITPMTSFPAPSAPTPMDPVSLASYLETHREVPYPLQWVLPPVTQTLYASTTRAPKSTDWLDTPLSREWRSVRSSQHAITPTEPAYSFSFKSKGGSLRDARFSWTMTPGQWTYALRLDNSTGMRKTEILSLPHGTEIITTYIHAQNYDSLRFLGPDGRTYLWVSHAPLDSTHGGRYDTLRHALFVSNSGHDPLYGEIVADHAYWDGFIDYSEVHRVTCAGCGASPINGLRWKCKACVSHDICEQCRLANNSVKSTCSFTLANLPDEALYIRSSMVDPALVCATLQIMKDWEFHILKIAKATDPRGFKASEDIAREGELGRLSYWKADDETANSTKTSKEHEKDISPAKMAKMEKHKVKDREKAEKAKEKERGKAEKAKEKEKKGAVPGVSELIIGSAQVGGAVGDVGEGLRDVSRNSTSTS